MIGIRQKGIDMKTKHVLLYMTVLCLLTGCGSRRISDMSNSSIGTTLPTSSTDAATPVTTTSAAAQKAPEDLVMECLKSTEVYEEIALSDFITETNAELIDGSVFLDTTETGTHKVNVPCLYQGQVYTKTLRYTVEDTTPPIILSGGWSANHLCGTTFDLGDSVGFADNYDKTPTLTYSGEIDPDSVGTYPITATIQDSSGNSESWELTVNVVNELPPYEDNNPRVDFSDFIAQYDNGNVRFGIDVSAWQADIDFDAVRDAGCSFVIIRIGTYYDAIKMDDYFRINLEHAAAAGLDVGIYYYTTDRSVDGIKEHARWITDQLDGQELDFPIVFDWEDFSSFQEYGMSIRDLNDLYEVFADEMESYGYSAMLYSSKNFLNNFWSEKTKASHPVWLAHYTDETDYAGNFSIWQASAYGRIPGIAGDVDMDIQYLDMPMD